jgi:hypothetical protein
LNAIILKIHCNSVSLWILQWSKFASSRLANLFIVQCYVY